MFPPANGPIFARMLTRILLAAALSALAALPARAGLWNPTHFTLDNGLEVVVIEDHRAPVISHMIWYRVGSADEPPLKSGIAHFLEHLLFKGTEKLAPGEFSKIVAENGGEDNAFTSFDYTAYFQNVARDKLDLVMGMEADRMVNLRLDAREVATERKVVLEERDSRTDNNPSAILGEAVSAAQFMAHPYGRPIIGWEHEIEALDLQDALDFYRRHYAPNNAILIVAGDVDPQAVLALARKHFGPIPRGPEIERRRIQEPPQLAERRVTYRDARVRQPSLQRTYLAPSRVRGESRHAVPLQFLDQILGGGSLSRLYQDLVVKRKLAAQAGSYYSSLRLDHTAFLVYANPNPGVDLDALETAMDETLTALLRDGVNEEEVERARSILLAEAIYARDSLQTGARIIGMALTSGLTLDMVESWPDAVRAVDVDAVNAAARHVLELRRSVTGRLLPEKGA